jgi:fluoride exporter
MLKIILVLLGGAIGTGCRYGLSSFVYSHIKNPKFPYANFIINVSGSFVIGLLAELFNGRIRVPPATQAALIIGVLGGYTTFSSFSYETFTLIRGGEWLRATLNSVGSVLLGLIAVWLGVRLAQSLWFMPE